MRSWWRGWAWGIRARVAAAAITVVAFTLIGGAVVLVFVLHSSLLAGVDDSLLARAENVSAGAHAHVAPSIATPPRQASLVQVLDNHGKVVAATGNIDGEDPILTSPPSDRTTTFTTLTDSPLDTGGEFRVLALPTTVNGSPGWVYTATSLSQVDAATSNLITLFAIGLPAVLIIVGFTVWGAVSLALRPVERIRREAADIGASDLSRRLPIPASRDEISRLATTMNGMLDRLDVAATRQRQFIGDASHELRSPLAGMRAQVDVALAGGDPEQMQRTLATVRHEADRMTTLTEDLLFLARSTESDSTSTWTPVDLDDLVLAQARRLRDFGGKTIRVHVQAARVRGSARDLSRLLRNLADNAYEHATSNVELVLQAAAGSAEVMITDDGDGIPEEHRSAVFERFTRLDDSRTRDTTGGGFGLGLAIARQIANAHGGTLTAHPRTDGASGAMFLLRLALSDD
ncbi:sensor histidine kinase [Humibacter sp.]|uniref:sensor histidine kinase n=1 Tax=Humibacter sp. TaxID=1940291 RepID=UPI003F7E3BDF